MLVLKHYDASILLFLTPTYVNAVLPGLSTIQHIEILQKRLFELIVPNEGIPIPVPYSNVIPS